MEENDSVFEGSNLACFFLVYQHLKHIPVNLWTCTAKYLTIYHDKNGQNINRCFYYFRINIIRYFVDIWTT